MYWFSLANWPKTIIEEGYIYEILIEIQHTQTRHVSVYTCISHLNDSCACFCELLQNQKKKYLDIHIYYTNDTLFVQSCLFIEFQCNYY